MIPMRHIWEDLKLEQPSLWQQVSFSQGKVCIVHVSDWEINWLAGVSCVSSSGKKSEFLTWWRWSQHHQNIPIKFVNNLSSACPNIKLVYNNHCYYDLQVIHEINLDLACVHVLPLLPNPWPHVHATHHNITMCAILASCRYASDTN